MRIRIKFKPAREAVSQQINHERRRLFCTVAMTIAATQVGMTAFAAGQFANGKPATVSARCKRISTQWEVD